jgi:hypothetical protein
MRCKQTRAQASLDAIGSVHGRWNTCVLFVWLSGIIAACMPTAPAWADIPQSELDTLNAIYSSTNGSGWTKQTGWSTGSYPVCGTWFGIICDPANSTVTEIGLSENALTGSLPALGGLPNLQGFDVDLNQLGGSIPPLAGLTSLQFFNVSNNNITGSIPALDGLTNLQHFDAGYNQLSGPIPALTGLTKLQYFGVEENQLSGSIPALEGLANLNYFNVGNNAC